MKGCIKITAPPAALDKGVFQVVNIGWSDVVAASGYSAGWVKNTCLTLQSSWNHSSKINRPSVIVQGFLRFGRA